MRRTILALSLLTLACSPSRQLTQNTPSASLIPDGKLFTAFFQQRSAEYAALCMQAYNMAGMYLEQLPRESLRPRAVILDLDETVLDNSPYAVKQGLQGKDFEAASWAEWTAQASAKPVPGSLEFLQRARKLGFVCYYVTNRDAKDRAATLVNIQKLNLPYADEDHLMTRTNESSKEGRRQAVAKKCEIVMLVGDNLADLKMEFEKQSEVNRLQEVRNIAPQLGTKYIVIPNANYGDWESAFYQYKRLTLQQKDSMLRADLQSF